MTIRPLPDEPLFDLKQAAAKLNMSVKTLMGHVHAHRIRYINIGTGAKRKTYRFTEYMLEVFMDEQQVKRAPQCQSTSVPTLKPTAMTSKPGVIDFLAIPKPGTEKTPKPSNVN
jgi:hypothetical protein